MRELFSFFHGAFSFFKVMTKQMYRNCAIIASGVTIVAVVSFNSTCYGGSGKNNVTVAYSGTVEQYPEEDEDTDLLVKEAETETSVTENSLEIQHISLILDMTSYVSVKAELEVLSVDMVGTVADMDKQQDVDEHLEEPEIENVSLITLTDEDYNNLVRIVEAEATGLDMKAKILVANVVINRVLAPEFPDNATDVIYQGNGIQFQPIMDGRFYSVELTDTSYEAVDRALYGEDYSEGALFFATPAAAGNDSWFAYALDRLFEYEGHVFFTFKS